MYKNKVTDLLTNLASVAKVVRYLTSRPKVLGSNPSPAICRKEKGVITHGGPYLLNGSSEAKNAGGFGPMV